MINKKREHLLSLFVMDKSVYDYLISLLVSLCINCG